MLTNNKIHAHVSINQYFSEESAHNIDMIVRLENMLGRFRVKTVISNFYMI